MNEIIERMRSNAKAYNKHITDEYLAPLSPTRLLCLTNPLIRYDFANELRKAGANIEMPERREEEL